MKKTCGLLLVIAMLIPMLSACAGSPTPPDGDGFVDVLCQGLKENNLPLYDPLDTSESSGISADMGAYNATQYHITTGVSVSIYYDPDDGSFLGVMLLVDMNYATREKLTTGAFATTCLVGYFDAGASERIDRELGLRNISLTREVEADGAHGRYQYNVYAERGLIYLHYFADRV